MSKKPFSIKVAEALDSTIDGRGFGAEEKKIINLCNSAPALLDAVEYILELDSNNEPIEESDINYLKKVVSRAKK